MEEVGPLGAYSLGGVETRAGEAWLEEAPESAEDS